MSPMLVLFQIVNVTLIVGGAVGFVMIVVSLWRISRALHSIAASLRVLIAHRTASGD